MKFCRFLGYLALGSLFISLGCSSLPEPKHNRFGFPKERAFTGVPDRPFEVIGQVRTKVNYESLDALHEESALCKNYFNKAIKDLVKRANKNGADAVIQIRSIVFLEDGRREEYPTPECSDDGMEGQILAQGIAIKWVSSAEKKEPKKEAPEVEPQPLKDNTWSLDP